MHSKCLTLRQARACENAKTPARKCRCRCGGAHHGRALLQDGFEQLPDSDPHRVRPPQPRKVSWATMMKRRQLGLNFGDDDGTK